MALDDIEQLEARVQQLLDRHATVKKEKEAAEKRLQQKESEFHQLRGQLRDFNRERTEVREKVAKILGELDRLSLG